jgi:hypothetical protein
MIYTNLSKKKLRHQVTKRVLKFEVCYKYIVTNATEVRAFYRPDRVLMFITSVKTLNIFSHLVT